jgi:AcrR family transcriptional regulator
MQPVQSEDRRIRRTRKLLMDALIALSLKHGYEQVSIMDITVRADVSYSTFFRHFPDKDALLRAMTQEAIDALNTMVRDVPMDQPTQVGKLLFEHVEQHEALYRVIMSSSEGNRVVQSVNDSILQMVISGIQSRPNCAFPVEIVANHLVSGIMSLVRWWLEHHKPYPIAEMARIYAEMIIIPTERAAFGEIESKQKPG